MAVTRYVTVIGAGNVDGTDWANAWDMASWKTYLEASAVGGDIYYLLYSEDSYELTSNLVATRSGTDDSSIKIIGVSDTNNPPTESTYIGNMPDFLAIGYTATFGSHYIIRNISFSSDQADGIQVGQYKTCTHFVNCIFYGSSSSGYNAVTLSSYCSLIQCSIRSDGSGIGVIARADMSCLGNRIIGCRIHDCGQGIRDTSDGYTIVVNNVFYNNSTYGCIIFGTGATVLNNTFYNHDTYALRLHTSSIFPPVINNIFLNNATAILVSNGISDTLVDNNSFYGNTTDVDGCIKGSFNIATDPKVKNAAGHDFSLDTGSPCLNAGIDYLNSPQ